MCVLMTILLGALGGAYPKLPLRLRPGLATAKLKGRLDEEAREEDEGTWESPSRGVVFVGVPDMLLVCEREGNGKSPPRMADRRGSGFFKDTRRNRSIEVNGS